MIIKLKKVSFKNLIKAEYQKIMFLKFSKTFLGILMLTSLAMGLIFSITTNVTQGKSIAEMAPNDIISASMLGIDVAAIMLIIFTAISISNEFSTKLIHVSLAVTPNRKRFYFSKFLTYCLLAGVISLLVTFATFFAGQLVLVANGIPMASLKDNSLVQLIIGSAVMPVFYCLLTVAATFIFRSSEGGIIFSLVIMFIPALIKMFSKDIQRLILPILPQSSLHSLSGIVSENSYELLGNGASIFLLLLWIGITSAIGIFQLVRKDV
ncbi:hypothetical protein GOQ29_11895 [Clostridium sp. D2Q-14]|uniref:hypothetical protein n=1 Tax=Anaeromonas gelatinilytica TaxID=2683194 RepID=UPI00193B0568|nr:hypothetical protein [Anaeromonas gelatinilytica]MBS4536319.1 hypothetical protein [Anaeromonas gelatinilytica]